MSKPPSFKRYVNQHHPCLARIIDREDPSWDPTISYGGGHNVNDSYGIGQALPGRKMAAFGRDLAHEPVHAAQVDAGLRGRSVRVGVRRVGVLAAERMVVSA